MTREEAINKWCLPALQKTWNEKKIEEILKALGQEPCEDAISRQKVESLLEKYSFNRIGWYTFCYQMAKDLKDLPSVTPKQKMDKLSVLYRDDGTHNPPMFEKPECPTCGYELGKLWGYPFCPKCGQALDWEEEE